MSQCTNSPTRDGFGRVAKFLTHQQMSWIKLSFFSSTHDRPTGRIEPFKSTLNHTHVGFFQERQQEIQH